MRWVAGMISLCVMLPYGASAQSALPFPDMSRSWFRYQESVTLLKHKNVIGGYPDGTFQPKAVINRAEFLKIVFAARGGSEPVGGECFNDVPPDAWFAAYVCSAKRRGIVGGYPDGTFKPEQQVNTAEAIKMLLLAYGHTIQETPGAQWYAPYVSLLDRADILPDSSYLPWEPLTRERAPDLIVRVLRHDEERIVPRLSPGCGKSAGAGVNSVVVNGVERSYLLTTPKRYVAHDPFPLIVAFHGRTNSNEQVRSYFKLDRTMTDSFIAYPAGLDNGNGTRSWSDAGDKPLELRDIALFDGIVKQLGERYCIDMDRVFVVGHSLGAWFANSVACARGGIVRGSATVGGSSVLTNCPGPSAAMILNNPKDTLSPHKGAELTRDQRLKENGCEVNATPVASSPFSCVAYTKCEGDNIVHWCPHTIDHDRNSYYPHVWPDGTAAEIAEFFKMLD